MRIYQKLTPLTEEERTFASENHWIINWFFNTTNYSASEYYDVAAVGYLKAVKRWFAREDIHRYAFSTIARQAMRSYISSEMKKNDRRIRTISLDAPYGEDGALTLADMITYDNYSNCYVRGGGIT